MEEVEAPSCQNKDHSPIAKGKRTKRHRPLSPIAFSITSSPTNVVGDITTNDDDYRPRSSDPNVSMASSEDSTTTEEEDTARSLILLARGHCRSVLPNPKIDHHDLQFTKLNISNKKRYRMENTTTTNKVSDNACMYTCKTCNRSFSSFQALGGHRASHTKPKNEKRIAIFDEEDYPPPSKKRMPPNSSLSLQLNNISTSTTKPYPSPRMHECSYCGMQFTSGQALGGHMRRHRAVPVSQLSHVGYRIMMESDEQKKPGNGLSLDLNLPALEDGNKKLDLEKREQQQQNEGAGKCLLLSNTPTLVDCP